MKISFQKIDNFDTKIFFNNEHIGNVKYNIGKSKWRLYPVFRLRWPIENLDTEHYDSSYEAGKRLAEAYQFINLESEDTFIGDYGLDLDEILSFLNKQE